MSLKEALANNTKYSDKYKIVLQDIKKAIEQYGRIDKNDDYYITSSIDMETFLWIKWGKPELMQKNMENKM